MNLAIKVLFFILPLSNLNSYCWDNSASSNINVNNYLEMQDKMITKMRTFISQDRERVTLLKTYLHEWKKWRESYLTKETDYITIPTNLIHLFKKFTVDFPILENIMNNNRYKDTIATDDITPPTDNILKNIILSLVDLQYIYDLKPQDIMNGKLGSNTVSAPLSEDTCSFIVETCLEYNQHVCAIDWLNTGITLTSDTEKLKKIYKQLYSSYLFLGNKDQAVTYAEKYMTYDPLDKSADDILSNIGSQIGKVYDSTIIEANRICGEDNDRTLTRNFKCRYNHDNSPFLTIAPLKEEQLYDTPNIFIYLDVVYDSEMTVIISETTPKMKTALVSSPDGKGVPELIHRTSLTSFMNNKSNLLPNLTTRIADISCLSLEYSEYWQVINYAPGGFYRVHSDYVYETEKMFQKFGNRMMTMLFYLNDVPLGGETVFPNINLKVKPIKGSVLVWHNMLADGSHDSLTDHAACPVIVGEKWAFTQWIRSKDQLCLRRAYERIN